MMVATQRQSNPSGRTIRVSNEIYDRLQGIAQRERIPIGEVVADLIREHEDKVFFDRLNEATLRLRADESAWNEYQAEISEWDVTLLDGLEEE